MSSRQLVSVTDAAWPRDVDIRTRKTRTTPTTGSDRFVSLFCVVTFRSSPVVDMSVRGDHGGGAAKRRRDRRLRMHWRHEQLALQMALAAALHHGRDVRPVSYNALRSQRIARAGVWERELNYTATIRDLSPIPPLPTHTHTPAGALQP